ncbi:MAG: methyl-accepting chemotaxis protein, partial [Paraburkholderia nemoris]
AAKEIKDLIATSVDKIRDGSALAGEAGKTMTEVTQAVARVTDIMAEIAAASTEQSRGIEQVNLAITQMDNVTQQNAALVEEAAAASRSMEDQGEQLTDAVAFFQVKDSAAAVAVAAVPVRREAPRREVAATVAAAPKRVARATAAAPVAALATATVDEGWDKF